MKSGRIILISVLLLIFIGLIVFSSLSVKFYVSDGNDFSLPPQILNEYDVTELSLTHSIERDQNGEFILPVSENTIPGSEKACPT